MGMEYKMASLRQEDEIIHYGNIVADATKIFVGIKRDGRNMLILNSWDNTKIVRHWSKYQIKETDRRVKTATFSSPEYFDLTTGRYVVLITSPYHDDFGGHILSCEYNEETGMYDYQCQDNTRNYLSKKTCVFSYLSVYDYIKLLLLPVSNKGGIDINQTIYDVYGAELETYKEQLAGLLPASAYEQSYYGSIIKFNPMLNNYHLFAKDVRTIDLIRNVIYGTGAYIDVYFDKYGVLQFEPYNRNEWENTGLRLLENEVTNRKVKFDTTNVITEVRIMSKDMFKGSDTVDSTYLLGLDLSAFFGRIGGGMMDLTETNDEKTNNANKSATSTTTNSQNTSNGNPYNNKAKKVWINTDNGSTDMKDSVISLLKNKGWTVHDGGTGSNNHYTGYSSVTSDYSVYCTMYNGFCAGTVQEAYSTSIQNKLKNKGVELVIMWDSRLWNEKMKPYKYGDFTGYTAHRAWDDNFSNGDPTINNVSDWLKKNNAKYCVSPTAEGLVEQFVAGGYFKYKGV